MKLYLNILLCFVVLVLFLADFSFVQKIEKKMVQRGCLEVSYDKYGDPYCSEGYSLVAKK